MNVHKPGTIGRQTHPSVETFRWFSIIWLSKTFPQSGRDRACHFSHVQMRDQQNMTDAALSVFTQLSHFTPMSSLRDINIIYYNFTNRDFSHTS